MCNSVETNPLLYLLITLVISLDIAPVITPIILLVHMIDVFIVNETLSATRTYMCVPDGEQPTYCFIVRKTRNCTNI